MFVSNGKKGYIVALDKQLELHNYDYSKDIAYSTNSTHALKQTFEKISSNREASKIVREMQETAIGYQGTNTYSYKDSTDDVFALSNKLFTDGLTKQQKVIDGNDPGALSNDVLQAGVDMLQDKVADFNTKNTLLAQGITLVSDNTAVFGSSIDSIDSTDVGERIGGSNYSPIGASALNNVTDKEYIYRKQDGQHIIIGNVERVDIIEEGTLAENTLDTIISKA